MNSPYENVSSREMLRAAERLARRDDARVRRLVAFLQSHPDATVLRASSTAGGILPTWEVRLRTAGEIDGLREFVHRLRRFESDATVTTFMARSAGGSWGRLVVTDTEVVGCLLG